MSTLYCTECGYKNEYSLHPPSFCGGCGARIDGVSSAEPQKSKSRPKRKLKKPTFLEGKDDDETDIDYVPDIGKLDVDISYEGQARVFKGQDLIDLPEEDLSDRTSA